jgi:hypothetical protein
LSQRKRVSKARTKAKPRGRKRGPRSIALIEAYDKEGSRVYRKRMSLDRYYDGPEITGFDQTADIRRLKIRTIVGRLWSWSGSLTQEFEIHHDSRGQVTYRRAVFDDRTVHEEFVRRKTRPKPR